MNTTMKYKGYKGSVEYSDEDGCFYGKVLGVDDCISYEGDSQESLETDFHESVDAYLDSCLRRNVQPRTPYSGTITLRLSPDEHSRIASLAHSAGTSVSAYIRRSLALL